MRPSRSLTRTQPRKKSLAACISRCPTTTRRPWLRVLARADEPLEHRRLRLLRLQEQGIVLVAADHEEDPGPRPDAADADHLARRVDVFELLDGVVIAPDRPPVRGDQLPHRAVDLLPRDTGRRQVLDRNDQRRVGDDLQLAFDLADPLPEHALVVALPRLGDVLGRLLRLLLAEALRAHLALDPVHDLVDVQVVVPGVERAHLRGGAHLAAGTRPTQAVDDRRAGRPERTRGRGPRPPCSRRGASRPTPTGRAASRRSR